MTEKLALIFFLVGTGVLLWLANYFIDIRNRRKALLDGARDRYLKGFGPKCRAEFLAARKSFYLWLIPIVLCSAVLLLCAFGTFYTLLIIIIQKTGL